MENFSHYKLRAHATDGSTNAAGQQPMRLHWSRNNSYQLETILIKFSEPKILYSQKTMANNDIFGNTFVSKMKRLRFQGAASSDNLEFTYAYTFLRCRFT